MDLPASAACAVKPLRWVAGPCFDISVLSCFPCEQAALCKYQILLTRIDTASQVGVQVIQSESPTLTAALSTRVNRPRRQFGKRVATV